MKTHKIILSMTLSIFLFSACSISINNEEQATKIQELEKHIEELSKQKEEVEPKTTEKPETTKIPVVKEYTGSNFINLSSPKNDQEYYKEPITFSGKVSPNTTKIVATAEGPFLDTDIYKLQNFNYGDSKFNYSAKQSYNNLAHGSNTYTFTAYFDDNTKKSTSVTIYYSDPTVAEMGKPVIYLYPEKTQEVFVNVKPKDGISISIPEINKGWLVEANPDGTIKNKADNKLYPYLFWEGFASNFKTPKEGFIVSKDEVESFFQEKLQYMGLTEKEIKDFGEFWYPKFIDKPYYFFSFIPQSDFEKYAPLTVIPKPDTTIRVFFDYKELNEKTQVPQQVLKRTERKGFTVVEWGGRLY